MIEHREREWAEVEALALRLLEHPKDLEPREPIRRYGSVVRLWHYPAFAPQRTWTILTPGRKAPPGAGPMVREVLWDRQADGRCLFEELPPSEPGTLPRMGVRDAFLPATELQRLLDAAAQLSIPLVLASKTLGLDGERFGLETYNFSPFMRLEWWCDGPTEWRHFTDWVAELRAFVQRHLGPSG